MKEIEVKILDINVKEIESKLKKLGAKKTLDTNIEVIYYDINQPKEKDKKNSLRLRKKGNVVEFTFKKRTKTKDLKICDEYEVNVSNFEEMKVIISALGYKIKKELTKHRLEYKIDNVNFELDTYENEPTLLEIEAPNKKEIEKYVKLLGYTMKDAKGWSYAEVLKYYKNKRKKSL